MRSTKGIVLAGGSGSRLYPMTAAFSKQLQPVYDKPMIAYPLTTLMMAGIREILIISTPSDTPVFQRVLGDGSQWGVELSYAVQDQPRGIADAFRVGKSFIADSQVCLILGDNIFYGKLDFLRDALESNEGATVFGYHVLDPQRYGVVELSPTGEVLSLEEKPLHPKSHLAVPGVYVYGSDVCDIAASLTPSERGELEITDVHRAYLKANRLRVVPMGRGIAWLDTGTPESMLEAGTFIHAIEKRQGMKIGCIEEVAWRQGFIDDAGYQKVVAALPHSSYRAYCEQLFSER